MDSEQAEKVKKIWGWTDEEFKCLSPENLLVGPGGFRSF